jgi:hypothetical protein
LKELLEIKNKKEKIPFHLIAKGENTEFLNAVAKRLGDPKELKDLLLQPNKVDYTSLHTAAQNRNGAAFVKA